MTRSDSTAPSQPPPSRTGITIVLALLTVGFVGAWTYKNVLPEAREFKYAFAPYYAAWFTGQSGVWRLLACPTFAGTSIIWVCLLRRLRRVSHPESALPDDNCPVMRKDCAI